MKTKVSEFQFSEQSSQDLSTIQMASSTGAELLSEPYTFGSLRVQPSQFREEASEDALVLLPDEWSFADSTLTSAQTSTPPRSTSAWGSKTAATRMARRRGFIQKRPLEGTTLDSPSDLTSFQYL